MSDSTLEQILKLATVRAEAAEVYYLSSQDTPIEFENNRLKSLQTKALQGVALRLIYKGKLGFASSTDLTRLEDLVDAAIQTAEIGDPAEFELADNFQMTAPETTYTPPSTQELVEVGKGLIEQVHAYNPDILVDVGFHVRSGRVKIATTRNVYAERSSQILSGSISGNLVRGEDFLQAYGYDVARDRPLDTDSILQTLLQKYRWAENQATITSGSYPVLFTPRAAASTLASLFDTILSGQVVVQKASPLVDKVGETLFDKRFTLFEDPTIGPSACPFDDEGTPTSRKVLIDQGTVMGFYWDRRWAARAGVQSTGNGFRGGLSRPGPDLVNLCIAPGNTPTSELIASMEEGLIVDQVLGAGQSNELAGEFSVNLDLGYKVEKGQIVGRVKNTMVAGSIFEAFKNLADLGSEPEWVGGGAYLPSMLFQQLGVASRQN
ncbi:metallopeptidase TldD-related protein [Kamptonema animale CS-326]|uniref:TldD/PmbA family protein n=1 Tax=Kamptonema animale TaxID=92934 RepID=UPI00232D164C|nr:metallopeptidase TldD-related protein [Kamptonema animale]MDB9514471.1 metallopeptidase TldD-related protein [Kamptonema animale CS-326]